MSTRYVAAIVATSGRLTALAILIIAGTEGLILGLNALEDWRQQKRRGC